MAALLSLLLLVLCAVELSAWSPPRHQHRLVTHHLPPRPTSTFLAAEEKQQQELIQDDTDKESTTAVYGVSYIGGDPCGSKYNDDPFDAKQNFKPGLPDDMKDRIATLAAKKALEQKEKED